MNDPDQQSAEHTDNPAHRYPEPEFPQQDQPHPGRTGHMDPVPDHGEDTYRGSGRLRDRVCVITGGD